MRPSNVYLVTYPQIPGHYKIGIAFDVQKRMKELMPGCPFMIEVVHVVETDNARELETELHRQFRSKRLKREWFLLSESDVDYIKSIRGRDRAQDVLQSTELWLQFKEAMMRRAPQAVAVKVYDGVEDESEQPRHPATGSRNKER